MPICRDVSREGKYIADFITDLHANKDEAGYGKGKTTGRKSRTQTNDIGDESVEEKDFRVIV